MTTRIELSSGKVLEVEADFEPASGDGYNSPRSPAHFEVWSAKEDGIEADLTQDENIEIVAALWHAKLEANANDLGDREAAHDAKAEQRRTERSQP